MGRTFSYKYFLDFEEKYEKILDCRTFNYFKFSHFNTGTSATLTVCVTILICCFAWTTTSTTLSSASSSPRAGNFNWPLVLFNKDGKLQFKKIDECMKTWWINIFTFFEMLARIFVFLFSNNRSISIYCLRIYEINRFILFHARLKRIELFWTELFWQTLQIHQRKRRKYFEQRDKVKIADQSEALFKQKRRFKTKTNDRIASRLVGLCDSGHSLALLNLLTWKLSCYYDIF